MAKALMLRFGRGPHTVAAQGMLIFIACLCLSSLMLAQQTLPSLSVEERDKIAVEASFKELQTAKIYTGFSEKAMSRIGDRVAIILIRSHDFDNLKGERNTWAVAQLMYLAFVDPPHIVRDEDRSPRVSLLLLKYLLMTSGSESEKHNLQMVIDELNRKR